MREKKAREQALAAPAQLAQLGIRTPRELFERFAAIFGCAAWEVGEEADGAVLAETRSCLACAIARKRGGGRPCDLYCINPFRGLAAALQPARRLEVEGTLWEGGSCRFRLPARLTDFHRGCVRGASGRRLRCPVLPPGGAGRPGSGRLRGLSTASPSAV